MLNRLTEAVAAVCPIDGVSGTQGSVRIDYRPEATQPQRDAALAVVAAFDWSQAAHNIWLEMNASAVIGVVTPKRLEADVSTTSNVLQDVLALRFQLAPNRHYRFEFTGGYRTANTNTGIQLAVNGPAGGVGIVIGEISTTATARTTGVAQAYNTPLVGANGGGPLALPWSVWGTISTGASGGAFLLRAASEVNGSQVTLLDKSHALLHCLG